MTTSSNETSWPEVCSLCPSCVTTLGLEFQPAQPELWERMARHDGFPRHCTACGGLIPLLPDAYPDGARYLDLEPVQRERLLERYLWHDLDPNRPLMEQIDEDAQEPPQGGRTQPW